MNRQKRPFIFILILCFLMLQFIIFPNWARADCPHHSQWNGKDPSQNTNNSSPGDPNNNNNTPESSKEGEPVEIATGNYTYEYEDINIPGRGPEFVLTRSYNSRSFYDGPLGNGWDHNYNLRFSMITETVQDNPVITRDKALIQHGFGRKEFFLKDPNNETFSRPPGCFADFIKNPDLTYSYREKDGTEYIFNPDGFLTRIVDRNGNALTLDYDGSNRLLYVTDPAGRKLHFSYNQASKISQATIITSDPNDTRIFKYEYDQQGNLIRAIGPMGNTTSYTYDENHNLLTITDPKENKKGNPIPYLVNTYDSEDRVIMQKYGDGEFQFQYYPAEKKTIVIDRKGYKKTIYYNNNKNPVTEIDHQGNTVIKEWNSQMNMTVITDALGNTTSFEYDDRGNHTKIIYPVIDANTSLPITRQMEYEPIYNKITKLIDQYGRETIFEYDEKGNLTKITDPLLNDTILTYDSHGQLKSVTDANLNTTKFSYDTYGNLNEIIRVITDGPNYVTKMAYDTLGNITEITDPRGNKTSFGYDASNRLVSIVDALNNPTEYKYDATGNTTLITFKDSLDNVLNTIAYEYDLLDRLTKIIDDLDNTTMYEYDKNDNRTKVVDANGNTTTYNYNSLDQLVSETDAESNVTQYSYDENGNLKTLTDAKYKTTFFAYDDMDRLTQMKYPDMSTEKYTYDYYGNITSFTNRGNEKISYEYDTLGRRKKKIYPNSDTISYSYDDGGRLTQITDKHGDIIYEYDEADRVTSVTYPEGNEVSYEYDEIGNRTKLVYPGQVETITYLYDTLNRLTDIKDSSNNVIAHYTYDALSRRTRVDLGNGTYTAYTYNTISQLTNLINKITSPEEIISSFSYTYDKVNNRKTMTTLSGTHNYTYDKIYQLTQVIYPDMEQTEYQLDPLGNRIDVTSTTETISYITNWLNQYTQVGEKSLSYDTKGNLISDGTTSYTYTCENMLIEAVAPQGTITYDYDALGRRIKKITSSMTRNYIYDGSQVIMEIDESGTEMVRYVYGPGIDEPLTITANGSTYYYHFDGLGSTSDITDSSGNLIEFYTYEVYGKQTIKNSSGEVLTESSVGNPYTFTGRRYDQETGLYYYRVRYYSAELGKFLTPDTIGFAGGDFNLYRYVNNNPLNLVDPWGLCGKENGLDKFPPVLDLVLDLNKYLPEPKPDPPQPLENKPWWPKVPQKEEKTWVQKEIEKWSSPKSPVDESNLEKYLKEKSGAPKEWTIGREMFRWEGP